MDVRRRLTSTHKSGVQGGEASLPGSGVSPANSSLPCVRLRRRQVMAGCQPAYLDEGLYFFVADSPLLKAIVDVNISSTLK